MKQKLFNISAIFMLFFGLIALIGGMAATMITSNTDWLYVMAGGFMLSMLTSVMIACNEDGES